MIKLFYYPVFTTQNPNISTVFYCIATVYCLFYCFTITILFKTQYLYSFTIHNYFIIQKANIYLLYQ